jgi:hypothetical protein
MKNFNHINVALAAGLFTLTASFALADAAGTASSPRDGRRTTAIETAAPSHEEAPATGEIGGASTHEGEIELAPADRDGKEYIPAPKPGDINGDGRVDVDDFLLLVADWGACENGEHLLGDICPVGGDCMVDVDDLMIVINNWES